MPSKVRLYTAVTGAADPHVLAALRLHLNAEERERADKIRQPGAAFDFAAAHALLRHALRSDYANPAPEFELGAFGKPRLLAGGLRFSITHTRGLVACAICQIGDIGVDAEPAGPVADALLIARNHFAQAEQELLAAAPTGTQNRDFLKIWTLKEAVIKATGLGLQLDSGSFEVGLDPPQLLRAGPELQPLRQWALALCAHEAGFQLALALRATPPADLIVERVEVTVADLAGGAGDSIKT